MEMLRNNPGDEARGAKQYDLEERTYGFAREVRAFLIGAIVRKAETKP
jgi:hypothetical protein